MTDTSIFIDDGVFDPASRFYERRKQLAKRCPGIIVLFGSQRPFNYNHPWAYAHHPICQEPLFLFLTGINQLNCALIIESSASSYKETLFVPKKDPHKEFWEGLQFGVGTSEAMEHVSTTTGFEHVANITTLQAYLFSISPQNLWMYWHESNKQKPLKNELLKQKKSAMTKLNVKRKSQHLDPLQASNLESQQWELRLPIDIVDKHHLITANQHLTQAFTSMIQQLKTFESETQVAGCIKGSLASQSPFGEAFPPIIASGKNAAVLHYVSNSAPLEKNSLLLIDFGTCWYSMHADVSRTLPVNGTFTPLQKLLYNIVLDTQIFVESLIQPGATIEAINKQCWDYMNNLLAQRFTKKGGFMKRPYKTAPHFVSHLLGRQTHDGDSARNYKSAPLQPGWVITNEPGLYGYFTMDIDGKSYSETLGIRIEDDIMVTNSGNENLTSCPKTIEELEALFK